jgi:hypothetical protein
MTNRELAGQLVKLAKSIDGGNRNSALRGETNVGDTILRELGYLKEKMRTLERIGKNGMARPDYVMDIVESLRTGLDKIERGMEVAERNMGMMEG